MNSGFSGKVINQDVLCQILPFKNLDERLFLVVQYFTGLRN